MLHIIFLGLIIGWGIAIPLGPVNLEIMRRNLTYGLRYGVAIGFGATTADLTFIILLLTGALMILQHPDLLRILGIIGSLILFWFGWQAISAKVVNNDAALKNISIAKCFMSGYMIAISSPFNILFWASLSSQVITLSEQNIYAMYFLIGSILLGIISWMVGLNIVIHYTRHKISPRIVKISNIVGGVILWGFAAYGLVHALL